MTLAGAGAEALAPNIEIAFPTTSDGTIPGRKDLEREPVEVMLKEMMTESQGWGFANEAGFGGLARNGVPLVLNIIQSIVQRLLGLVQNFPGVRQALDAIENFPLFAMVKQITMMLQGQAPMPTLTMPFTIPAVVLPSQAAENPVVQFFRNALSFFNISNWLDGSFNPIAKAVEFIEGILKPTGILAWLQDGLLPNGLAPPIVSDIINTIENAVTGAPVIGNLIAPVFDALRWLLGISNDAQGSANTANTQVASILTRLEGLEVPGGAKIVEDFNEPANQPLPVDRWDVRYSGGGAGAQLTTGTGNLGWDENGGAYRGAFSRHRTKLNTKNVSLTIVIPGRHTGYTHVHAFTKMIVRCNDTHTDYLWAVMRRETSSLLRVWMGYAIGGTETQIGDEALFGDANGDTWELRAGTADGDYAMELLKNTSSIMFRQAPLSTLNLTTHNYAAVERGCGVNFQYPLFYQRRMPDLAVFVANDRAI